MPTTVNPPYQYDTSFVWRPKRIYIPAWQFAGLDYETTTATDIKSIGVGSGNDMAITEVNSSNITGIAMANAADTVEHLMAVPGDMDFRYPIYFRTWWTANNTSGSVLWKVFYKAHIANSTVVGTGTAATALDKVIASNTMAGVAYTLMCSAEGYIQGDKLGDSVEMLQLSVEADTLTTITTALFLGLEIRYTPRMMKWGSMLGESKPNTYIASKLFPN